MFKRKKKENGYKLDEMTIPYGQILSNDGIQKRKVKVKEELIKGGCDDKNAEEAALNYSISVLIANLPLEKLEMIEGYIIQIREK